MTLTANKTKQSLTFEEFITQLPDEEGRYELVDGEIIRLLPTRKHNNVAEFIADSFKAEVRRLELDYRVSSQIVIKTLTSEAQAQGRHPDVSVVNRSIWDSNLSAYTALLEPLQLAVEIVSTNWEDDYIDKVDEYQRLGIVEYWIVDYLAIASCNYLGNPKVPTIFVYLLDEVGNYQFTAYQDTQKILSRISFELVLTVEQILAA